MTLTINGTFVQNLPVAEGEGQRGHWMRGGFIVEYGEEYTHQVKFSLFGEERVALTQTIAPRTPVEVTFAPESREFNGKWYTDLRCVKIVPTGQYQPQPASAPASAYAPVQNATAQAAPLQGDPDLPF